MPQRTYQITGYADSSDITISVNFNGNNVYNGSVTASGEEESSILASFNADTSITGNVPVSISVSGGTLEISSFNANYSSTVTFNQAQEQFPDKTLADHITTLESVFKQVNNNDAESLDYRTNVKINGEDVTATHNNEKGNNDTRGWHYTVEDGSTITFDLTVDASVMPADVEDL